MSAKLTDTVPLRRSTTLPNYVEVYPIPHVYGRCTLSPQYYDSSGTLWTIADHPIGGVDRVVYQGRETAAWALQNGTDTAGNAIAVLETSVQVQSPRDLEVSIQGKLHPVTGELMERPDSIIWDFLANVCGLSLPESALDTMRAWSGSNGLALGGVVGDDTITVQAQLDAICQGAGLAWSWVSRDIAMPWPSAPAEPFAATINGTTSPVLTASSRSEDLVTRLVVEYQYDWARQLRNAVILESPEAIEQYGELPKTVQADWIRTSRSAEQYGRRLLEHLARPVFTITANRGPGSIRPGDSVGVDHPHSPVSSAFVTNVRTTRTGQRITCTAPSGPAPEIRLVGHSSGQRADPLIDPVYTYTGAQVTVQVLLPNTLIPAAGARVRVDGKAWLMTDGQGYVQFQADPGPHSLHVEPIGTALPFDISFTVT